MKIGNTEIDNKALITILVSVIALIIIFVFIDNSSTLTNESGQSNTGSAIGKINIGKSKDTKSYEETLDEELENILSKMKGVGDVKVMVTLETGSVVVPAVDNNQQETITNEEDKEGGKRKVTEKSKENKTIVLNKGNGEEALLLEEKKPTIKGVIVVAEGAKNPEIQYNICKAVQTALKIEADKVEVFQMK